MILHHDHQADPPTPTRSLPGIEIETPESVAQPSGQTTEKNQKRWKNDGKKYL